MIVKEKKEGEQGPQIERNHVVYMKHEGGR